MNKEKQKKQIAILGSTGSIGTQALQVIEEHADCFEARVLTANNRVELLIEQARRFMPAAVVIANEAHYERLRDALDDLPIQVYAGADALCQGVQSDGVDMVLTAMVGFAGLAPTIAAIRAALVGQGVKEENINTDFINIYPLYDYSTDQEQLAAYDASSTLAIRITDMESVGALIDVCFAAGANTLNGISFSASDTEEAKTEAMKKAVADTKKKAEILAEASGLKITGIEVISEGGVYSYQNNVGNVYTKGMDDIVEEAEADTGTVVQSAKLIVSASVSITFEAE